MNIEQRIDTFLTEAKEKYVLYHDTYTSAVNAALKYAESQGFEIDKEETADKIGMGPSKPGAGKTNRLTISLYKGGKKQNKSLHFQVYNRDQNKNSYELNAYVS